MKAIGIAVGVAGTILIGYCIYFDSKRRSDPDYKKKVRERRCRQRGSQGARSGMLDLNDHITIQQYFLKEVHLGKTMIAAEEYEYGVEHLANAVAVYNDPAMLLQILQTTLPEHVFTMLLMKMQEYSKTSGSFSNIAFINDSVDTSELSSDPLIIDDLE